VGWIIVSILMFVVAIPIIFAVGTVIRAVGRQDKSQAEGVGSLVRWCGPVVPILIWLIVTLVAILHQVPAGYSGVVYEFGAIVDRTGSGLQVIVPWQSITNATVQVQTLCFVDDEKKCPPGALRAGSGLSSFSKETQNVYIDAVVRIKVDPENIEALYSDVGSSYINKLIPGSIAQIFKDETVKYSAVDLAPNRDPIRKNVEDRLRNELSRFSINVDALLVENIRFDPEFEKAILDKQTATQHALEEQANIVKSTALANQQIEAARGTAESLKVNADGQAYANTTIARSLTPDLIQFQALQKLAANVQIAFLPSGQGIIIDPATILGGKKQTP